MRRWLGSILCRIGLWLTREPVSSVDLRARANAKILVQSLYDNEVNKESYKTRASRLGNHLPRIIERAEELYLESYGKCGPTIKFADARDKGLFIDDAINEYLDLT